MAPGGLTTSSKLFVGTEDALSEGVLAVIVELPRCDGQDMVMLLLGHEGVDDAKLKPLVLQVPQLQPPQIPPLMPLRLPLADMEFRCAMRTKVVLGEPVQKAMVAFQFLQQDHNLACGIGLPLRKRL